MARSVPTSFTNQKSNCLRYRNPPWISLVDLLEVPEAKSFFSIRATFIPREAASKAIPAPVIPPPITKISNSVVCNSC